VHAGDRPGTLVNHQRVERPSTGVVATRWYEFPGACVTQHINASTGPQGLLLNDASIAVGLTSRDALRDNLWRESGGRLELDEKTAR
jgi:hypothetical protein